MSEVLEKLLSDFKQANEEKGAHDLLSQVSYLAALAENYHQKGEESRDWTCLLRAHALYNSVAVRDLHNEDHWSGKAFSVQKTYWKFKGIDSNLSYDQQKAKTESLLRELRCIREDMLNKVENITAKCVSFDLTPEQLTSTFNRDLGRKFVQSVLYLGETCTQRMVTMVRHVIKFAVKIVGSAPCRFCAVALGSLARGEATPYSDLEFAFIISKSDEAMIDYFESLALTVYFLIGNLKETKLKYMAIDELTNWFDDVTTNGFKIDGLQENAGNIPTGNGSPQQRNHLIGTVNQLIEQYRNVFDNPDPTNSVKGDFSAVLSNTKAVYGDFSLLTKFLSLIQQITPNQRRQEAIEEMIRSDVRRYHFFPDFSINNARYLKKDLYRFPSLILMNQKIKHHILQQTPLDAARELVLRNELSQKLFESLEFTYCSALYIRLAAYLDHCSQIENISVHRAEPDTSAKSDQWSVSISLLLQMMKHLMLMNKYISSGEFNPAEFSFGISTSKTSFALTSYYCGDYHACYAMLKWMKDNQHFKNNQQLILMYVRSAYDCCYYDEALRTAENLLNLLEKNSVYPRMAECYTLMGATCVQTGDYRRALPLLLKSLEILKRIHGIESNHSSIAESLCILADLYSCQKDTKAAVETCHKSINILRSLHHGSDDAVLVSAYFSLGVAYYHASQYTKAELNYQKSLDMSFRLHGQCDLPIIARCYSNIAQVQLMEGDVDKALCYCIKSLQMHERILGESEHMDLADCYLSLGAVFEVRKQYEQALNNYNRCLEVCEALSISSLNPTRVQLYSNLGFLHRRLKNSRLALFYFTKHLKGVKYLRTTSDHPDVIHAYGAIGDFHRELGDFQQARVYLTTALDMCERYYESHINEKAAMCNANLADVSFQDGHYQLAIYYYTCSLEILKKLHKTIYCAEVALTYALLAKTHQKVGGIISRQLSHSYGIKSTQILEVLCKKREFSRAMAECYNHLSWHYLEQDEYKIAADMTRKFLEIHTAICGNSDEIDAVIGYHNAAMFYNFYNQYHPAFFFLFKSLNMNLRLCYGDISDREVLQSFQLLANIFLNARLIVLILLNSSCTVVSVQNQMPRVPLSAIEWR